MKNALKIFAVISCLLAAQTNAYEKIELKSSLDKSLASLNKIELVVYNEEREVVFKHMGQDLDSSLKSVDEGKSIYHILSEEEWKKGEAALRAEIHPQVPDSFDESKKKGMVDGIILDLKNKHTSPAVAFSVLKNGFPYVDKFADKKKIVVVYIPIAYCESCEAKNFNLADLEKKHPNMAFLEVAIK